MRNTFISMIAVIFVALSMTGCNSDNDSKPDYDRMYQAAISDAENAESGEIVDTLNAIYWGNPRNEWKTDFWGNQFVKVVTWTVHNTYSSEIGNTITTWWGETWVTPSPDLIRFYDANDIPDDRLDLRLKQLLGLPPDHDYLWMVELWVSPDDLFRPSADSEIHDSVAELSFPPGTSEEHIAWYEANVLGSYTTTGFPWTRLGYTYDWGNSHSEVGLSEYVIREGSVVEVAGVYSTLGYFEFGGIVCDKLSKSTSGHPETTD